MGQSVHDLNKSATAADCRVGPSPAPVSFLGIRLSPAPELRSGRDLTLVTLLVGLFVAAILASQSNIQAALGDADDALRLFQVRELLSGHGWFDQRIARMGPPAGLYMHWSRLLDGALAGVESLFRLVMPAGQAEWAMRFFWPLAWMFPAIAAALAAARSLGGRSAVLVTAILIAPDFLLFRQFPPGRIDHHNIQITLTMVALAGLLARRSRVSWAAVAGVSAALGLAVGLEALHLQALIGAGYGLALARDRKAAGPAAAYGLALAGGSALFFLIQTPPWRWSLSFCDALALNLVLALMIAGLGLAASARAAVSGPAWSRLALLALTGALSAGVYVAMKPICIHGPFAEMNPALRPFWFDHIPETDPLPKIFRINATQAFTAVVMMIMGLASAAYLWARQGPRADTGVITAAACFVAASVTGYLAWRMQDYVFWIGASVIGAAFSRLSARWLRDLMIPTVMAAILLSPLSLGLIAATVAEPAGGAGAAPFGTEWRKCFTEKAYQPLAALPRGLVLSETNMGAFIISSTPHATVSAPYHRQGAGILAAHEALDAPSDRAEARVRRLGVTYVADCPTFPTIIDPHSLNADLRAAKVPPWLQSLSRPGDVIRLYRVLPPGQTAPPVAALPPAPPPTPLP